MTTFILLGLCASGAWCLHRYIKGSDEKDRADLHALFEQRSNVIRVDFGPKRTTTWGYIKESS